MLVIGVLWTGFFLINFNVVMMIPLLPFVGQELGLSASESGLLLAAFPLVALASNLVLGPWIDRFGRRSFIILGASSYALLFAAAAAANSTEILVLCRASTGIFMPMVGASIFAAIADYIAPAGRDRVAGYVTTAAPVAFLLSISMGFLIGGLFSWRLPLALTAIVAALLAGCATRLPPTPADALSDTVVSMDAYRKRLLSLSLNAGTRWLFFAYFCWSAAIYTFLGLYPTWIVQHGLAGYSVTTIGLILFLGEAGGLFGAGLSGRLSRLHPRQLGACSLAAFATFAVVLVTPLGAGVPLFQTLAYGGFAFGRDMMLALTLGGAMLLVPAAQRGSLNAFMNATYQTGATVGGICGAWLYGVAPNFSANAMAAGLLLLVSGMGLWRVGRQRPSTAELRYGP
jgi:predicted MFS family arabinose efflux permease